MIILLGVVGIFILATFFGCFICLLYFIFDCFKIGNNITDFKIGDNVIHSDYYGYGEVIQIEKNRILIKWQNKKYYFYKIKFNLKNLKKYFFGININNINKLKIKKNK